jgi:hypothetical protein
MVVLGSASEAASWTSRSGTPASRAAVMNACRSVCGLPCLVIPARRVTRRTIRAAPCRVEAHAVRGEEQRPAGALADREVDCSGGARCERDRNNLPGLASDEQGPVTAFQAQVLDVGPGGL